MKTIEISGVARKDLGKKAAKAQRNESLIPCVIYGNGENIAFSVSNSELRKLVYTPDIYLVNLSIDGKVRKAVLKDIQFHPVKDNILHADFYEVSETKPIVMDVPIRIEGHAEGVRAGGKLSTDMRRIRVKGIYSDIPEYLTINVDKLGLGKTIQIGELSFDKLEIMNAKNAVVVAVKLTRAARGAAAAAQ